MKLRKGRVTGKAARCKHWGDRLFSVTKRRGFRETHCKELGWGDRLSSTLQIDGVTDKIVRKVGVTGQCGFN